MSNNQRTASMWSLRDFNFTYKLYSLNSGIREENTLRHNWLIRSTLPLTSAHLSLNAQREKYYDVRPIFIYVLKYKTGSFSHYWRDLDNDDNPTRLKLVKITKKNPSGRFYHAG